MRILLTGSRKWTDKALILETIASCGPGVHTVVHGDAEGADTIAKWACATVGWTSEPHPVSREEWLRLRKAAGPVRNQRMVDLGADVCLAFPTRESRGTFDCIARAQAAGIFTRVIAPPDAGDDWEDFVAREIGRYTRRLGAA